MGTFCTSIPLTHLLPLPPSLIPLRHSSPPSTRAQVQPHPLTHFMPNLFLNPIIQSHPTPLALSANSSSHQVPQMFHLMYSSTLPFLNPTTYSATISYKPCPIHIPSMPSRTNPHPSLIQSLIFTPSSIHIPDTSNPTHPVLIQSSSHSHPV